MKDSCTYFGKLHRALKTKESMLQEAEKGTSGQAGAGNQLQLFSLLDKGRLSPGTKVRVITGARP